MNNARLSGFVFLRGFLKYKETISCRSVPVSSLSLPAIVFTGWTEFVLLITQVVFIVYTFLDASNIDYRYFMWIFFFGMANSMVNPLIYGACTVCRSTRQKSTRWETRLQEHLSPDLWPYCNNADANYVKWTPPLATMWAFFIYRKSTSSRNWMTSVLREWISFVA